MAGERMPARYSLLSQLWFRWTGKCFETATSHMQNVVCNLNKMIEKVANNKYNTEKLNLNPPEKVKEKLDYYRSLLGKTNDLSESEFEDLKSNIKTFFNLKPTRLQKQLPERLVRISNNNRILGGQGKELSYLTDISELLAPPVKYCGWNRCNLPEQQVLYCATNEATAYWEIKPQKGDVITISHYKLKEKAQANYSLIYKDKEPKPDKSHPLKEVFYLLDDFFIDVYSFPVSRDRPKDYIFSALLSAEQLFYPIPSKDNIEAIIYPSVQKKKFGHNVAIRNDIVLDKYDLIGVETRFILDNYEDLDPTSDKLTTDNLIASFGTEAFDFEKGKILYDEKVNEIFPFLRKLQTLPSGQTRFSSDNMLLNLTKGKSTVTSNLNKDKK